MKRLINCIRTPRQTESDMPSGRRLHITRAEMQTLFADDLAGLRPL